MKKILKHILVTTSFILCSSQIHAQKIFYNFGQDSDVLDSIKRVVSIYKEQYKESDIKKLNLFIGIENCNGHYDIQVSQYHKNDKNMKKLAKRTNRFVQLDKSYNLPILFSSDILYINDRAYITMNGYYIKAERNENSVWKVTLMHPTF